MSESKPFRILIVGGGIGGLAAAVALRGPGRDVLVLEQSRMNKETGALISLQPNASKIATKLELGQFLAKTGPMVDRAFRIFNTRGELQTTINLEAEKYGADRVVYHRQDLHGALREAAISPGLPGPPARIRVASRVVRCNCEEGSVLLENGETVAGDLVLGADGIHSVIRGDVNDSAHDYARPTGLSAYRMLFTRKQLEGITGLENIVDLANPVTTMMFGFDRRLVMGPGRNASLFGVVALVPDEHMHEESRTKSWIGQGSVKMLLESFEDFPAPIKEMLSRTDEVALWQLRDIDPLKDWVKGRAILLGDAAHAMLPLQGQGASQTFEDVEALQEYFAGVTCSLSRDGVNSRLQEVFKSRYERATLIQGFSRQSANPATDLAGKKVNLTMTEFLDYNCNYSGARDWQSRKGTTLVV